MRRTLLLLFYALISVFLLRPGVPQPARFTSYYTGDATGSSSCTASGLCTADFQVDVQGRYTYHGDLVMATAVASCTASREGVCGQYNSLPAGYRQYRLKDRITFVMDGKTCHGIVLDICGACYWPEEKQRYDIFVSGRAAAADLSGTVRTPKTLDVLALVLFSAAGAGWFLLERTLRRGRRRLRPGTMRRIGCI